MKSYFVTSIEIFSREYKWIKYSLANPPLVFSKKCLWVETEIRTHLLGKKYQNENKESKSMCIWIMVIKLVISWREKNKTYVWNVMDFINGGSLGLQSGMKTCSSGLPMKTHSLPLADSVGDPWLWQPIFSCLCRPCSGGYLNCVSQHIVLWVKYIGWDCKVENLDVQCSMRLGDHEHSNEPSER